MQSFIIIARLTWPLVMGGLALMGWRVAHFGLGIPQPSAFTLGEILVVVACYQIFHTHQLRKKGLF